MAITTIKIFPSIGIARVGNSPDQFFIGPEFPGTFQPPEGGYKDKQCRIKRQAQRFRVYGYDGAGGPPIELTSQNTHAIQWTVKLANKKASWKCIFPYLEPPLRNAYYEGDRDELNIRPSAQSLSGKNLGPAKFDDGKFQTKVTVPLGEIRTDELGRLLVLGGLGVAGGIVPVDKNTPLIWAYPHIFRTYNTPGWYDDVADGPVTASVILTEGAAAIEAAPAWVITAPPDFAPEIQPLTTLWDVLRQRALETNWPAGIDIAPLKLADKPSFAGEIKPVLDRTRSLKWLSTYFNVPTNQDLDDTHKSIFTAAADPANGWARKAIFERLQPPGQKIVAKQTDMPQMFGDNGSDLDATEEDRQTILTQTQYDAFARWAAPDWSEPPEPPPAPFDPEVLTKTILDTCVGSALAPGIEAGQSLGKSGWALTEPFRLDHKSTGSDGQTIEAGDLTKEMSCPWQSDFYMCHRMGLLWWPSQRPDDVFPEALLAAGEDFEPVQVNKQSWERGVVFPPSKEKGREAMTQLWSVPGFVVRRGDFFVETEYHKVCPQITLVLDRTRFTKSEVIAPLPKSFDDAFYVLVEGLKPADLGLLTTADLDPVVLEAKQLAPRVDLLLAGVKLAATKAVVQELLLELTPFDPNAVQRLTFVYRMVFDAPDDFPSDAVGAIEATAIAVAKLADGSETYTASGTITLANPPHPYMLDGDTFWLSTDLRVFKVVAGQPAPQGLPGFEPPPIDAQSQWAGKAGAYISALLADFNADPLAKDRFEALPAGFEQSGLEIAQKVAVPGEAAERRVFNFALARVRYRGKDPLANVRVFFRLFTTAATGLDYNTVSTYPRTETAKPIALPGYLAGNVVSIPFFAAPRAAIPLAQSDPDNVGAFAADPAAGERTRYFGCWLDFNQNVALFKDPVTGALTSIQELIRALHQCLVAEIRRDGEEIPEGATPGSSDSLAQRNLMIVDSDNPGAIPSRIVQHTFELAASRSAPILYPADAKPGGLVEPPPFDEVMIRWGSLPAGTGVAIYIPDIAAAEIMALAERRYEPVRLQQIDAHTIRCLPGEVSYLPLPEGRRRNSPALLTVELPEGIKHGQRFDLTCHQIAGVPRRVLGAFQLTIPVGRRSALLAPALRALSVMRHIDQAIATDDPWHAVFQRHLSWMAARIEAFGGDPGLASASPDGSGATQAATCRRLGWGIVLVLALLIFSMGWHPVPGYVMEFVLAGLAIALSVRWILACDPSWCDRLRLAFGGLGLGAVLLGLWILLGLGTPLAGLVLACAAVALGVIVVAAWKLKCTVVP